MDSNPGKKIKISWHTLYWIFNSFRGIILSMTTRIRVKDCSNKNTSYHNLQSCIQKFIRGKMDCQTPWDGNDSNIAQRNCSSTEDLKKYFDLRLDIYRGKYKKELDECSIPNCFENHWNHKHSAKLSQNAFLFQHGKDVKNVQMYHFQSSPKKAKLCFFCTFQSEFSNFSYMFINPNSFVQFKF